MTKEEKEEWADIGQELQTLADGHPRFHVQYRMSSSQGGPLCCEVRITKKPADGQDQRT